MPGEAFAKPDDSGLLTCTQMGSDGTLFKILINEIRGSTIDQIINGTSDGDQRNRWPGRGHKFLETDLVIRGWLKGGAGELFGFINLGVSDDGYSGAAINMQSGHTSTGYLRPFAFNYLLASRAQSVPIAFRAKFDGIVEANPGS